jgi:hypothetical protein
MNYWTYSVVLLEAFATSGVLPTCNFLSLSLVPVKSLCLDSTTSSGKTTSPLQNFMDKYLGNKALDLVESK